MLPDNTTAWLMVLQTYLPLLERQCVSKDYHWLVLGHERSIHGLWFASRGSFLQRTHALLASKLSFAYELETVA